MQHHHHHHHVDHHHHHHHIDHHDQEEEQELAAEIGAAGVIKPRHENDNSGGRRHMVRLIFLKIKPDRFLELIVYSLKYLK